MAKKRSEKPATNIIELKKLLVDLEKSILATKKQIVAQDKKSADYLEKMAKLDAIRSKNRNEYYRIRRQIDQIEKESQKRAEKELKTQEDLTKQIEDENKELEKRAKKEEEKLKRDQKAKDLREKRRNIEKEILDLEEKSAVLMKSVNLDTIKQAETLKISGKSVSEIADKTNEIKKLMKLSGTESRVFEETLKHSVKNASSIDEISSKILENMDRMKERGYELVDTYQMERQLKEQTARLDLNKEKLGQKRYDIQKKMLNSQIQELNKLKEINKQLAEKSKSSKEIRESMTGWIAAVPGGSFLLNKLGLGKILKESKGIKETIKDWGTAAKGLAAALPFMALAGFFTLLMKVFTFGIKLVFDLDQRISDLSKQFQLSRAEATNMFATLGGMALRMNIIGINVKELADSLSYLAEEYGISIERLRNSTMKSGWLEGITILREKFQLTSEEALNFGKIAASQNMTMDQLAYNAERMSKGVLNAKSAFKAIGNVPMLIANGMKNAVGDLVKFVAKAKAMGIDIKAFSDALFGMMDIEQSLATQMEAQVITGFEFKNIDKVRELANVFGGEGKAYDLMMEDLSKLKDLSQVPGGKLGVKKIAETYGFTLDQFMDIFNRAKELEKVFGARNPMASMEKILSMNVDQLNAAAKKAKTAAQRDFLIGEAKKRTGASMEEKITDKGEKIQIEMMEKLIPVVDRLHKLVDSVLNSGELKKVVGMIAETLPTIFNGMIAMAEAMVAAFKKVLQLVEKTRDVLIDMGVLERVKKQGPIKEGEDPYETRVNPKLLPFDDTGSNMLFYGGLGIAGAIAAGKAIMHPIKTTKAVYNAGKWAKNKMFPGKVPIPTVNEVGPHSLLSNTHWDDVADMKRVGRSRPPIIVETAPELPSGWSQSRSGLYMPPETPKKAPTGIFEKTSSFFKNQFSKVGQIVDDTRMFGRRAMTKVDDFYKGIKYGSSFEWVGQVGKKLSGFADDAVKLGAKTFPKMGAAAEGIAKFGSKSLNVAKVGAKAPGIGTVLAALDYGSGMSAATDTFKNMNKGKDPTSRQRQISGATSIFSLGGFLYDPADMAKQAYAGKVPIDNSTGKEITFDRNPLSYLGFQASSAYGKLFDDTDATRGKISDFSAEALAKADKQRAITRQKTIDQFKNPGPSLFDKAWNSIFGVEQKTQPVKTTASPYYQTTRPVSDQKSVVVNMNTVPLEQKIEKLIMLISGMASQPTYIKIGEQTVEAIRSEINWKKQNIIGVDNRYAGGASD